MRRASTLVCVGLVILAGTLSHAAEDPQLPLVFEDDFEQGADHWQPTDPAAWKLVETERGKVYSQFQTSKYTPPYRSPYNLALLKDLVVGDFVLTAKVQSTNSKAGAHRDMCVFFGYQDPGHFYYVHLGHKPDPHSSQIMLVNGAPRAMITKNQSPGIPWTDNWHEVKVVRCVAEGTIEIYFDDMTTPVMTAVDTTFRWGQVGLGSFDDRGNWDQVKLYGVKVEGKGK